MSSPSTVLPDNSNFYRASLVPAPRFKKFDLLLVRFVIVKVQVLDNGPKKVYRGLRMSLMVSLVFF